MTLFTKDTCSKCDYIKSKFDLPELGIAVERISPDNSDVLAHLAWHELVETAQKELPILVLDDCSSIAGAMRISRYLKEHGATPVGVVGISRNRA